jgi:leader peptidase (prepilin peptidase)/N-methyltransferase
MGFFLGLILLAYLGVVIVIDLEHRLILHPVSLAGAILGVGIGTWLHGLTATLLGGLFGFAGMLALYYLGIVFVRLSARLRGQPIGEDEGIGFGDVNLSGVVGLLLGWPGILAGLLIAILLGGAVSLLYLLLMITIRRYRPSLALPYGPFLAASAIILLYLKDSFLG